MCGAGCKMHATKFCLVVLLGEKSCKKNMNTRRNNFLGKPSLQVRATYDRGASTEAQSTKMESSVRMCLFCAGGGNVMLFHLVDLF